MMNGLQTAWKKSFTERKYRIGLHVIFWIIYITLLLVFDSFVDASIAPKWHYHALDIAVSGLGDLILVGLTYYLTVFLSYRTIVVKKRYITGLLGVIVCIAVYINIFFYYELITISLAEKYGHQLPPYAKNLIEPLRSGYFHFMTIPIIVFQIAISYFFYLFLPVCCKFLRDQLRMQHKQSELQKKNIQLEMNFLKSQIHPHFLFNTLNNIYSLINYHENDKAREMVSGLSSLLRYSLYDGKSEFIFLDKEIAMIRDFIGLEEVRSDNLHLDVNIPEDIPAAKIPPFLLLPLVENAFKHGANSQLSNPCIKIEMEILDQHLWLQVRNCFDPEYRRKNSGGLGLSNMRKRLDYYYPSNYLLEINEKEDIHTATLKLPLSCPKLDA
jgi:hypothetical protein